MYKPRGRNIEIVEAAWEHVSSVPYRVSLRWLFYRLLDNGCYATKDDYRSFKELMSRVRKRGFKEWNPMTLADDRRSPVLRSRTQQGVGEWLGVFEKGLSIPMNWMVGQEHHPVIVYEANAMTPQFEYYTDFLDLYPCGGDPSIPYKAELAMFIKDIPKGREPVIIYFGDADHKGMQIGTSAHSDIEDWALRGVEFQHPGLTLEQARSMGLPLNFEKEKESYQWESLSDEQASKIIREAIEPYIDQGLITDLEADKESAEELIADKLSGLADDWKAENN